jgi:hypothetical protein
METILYFKNAASCIRICLCAPETEAVDAHSTVNAPVLWETPIKWVEITGKGYIKIHHESQMECCYWLNESTISLLISGSLHEYLFADTLL